MRTRDKNSRSVGVESREEMGGRILPYVTTAVLLSELLYSVASDIDGDAGQCASGFPGLDRIDAVLNYGDVNEFGGNVQAIIPSTNFICNGSIHSWVFGGWWGGSTDSLTELQIWRPSDQDGVYYNKVGSTTINVMERVSNQRKLYHYNLSSPLPFQAGDILGYYRSWKHVNLIFENVRSGHLLYYYAQNNAFTHNFSIYDETDSTAVYHVLVGITTDSPGCASGFMSVERMRLLLETGSAITIDQRQQITPDMRFTCNGMITKWIIGANWGRGLDNTLYPELQLWRSNGNNVYRKINTTLIRITTQSPNRIYEYNVPPIPVQAGDILGVFIPQIWKSKLRLIAENGPGPTNYYIPATVSPHDIIDTRLVTSAMYHPLVTVEIVVSSSTKSTETAMVSTTKLASTSIAQPSNSTKRTPTPPSTTMTMSSSVPTESTTEGRESLSIVVGVSVGVLLVIIATAIVITISVTVWLKRKNKLMTTADSVAYDVNSKEIELSDNVAYFKTTLSGADTNETYDYIRV